MGMDNIILIKKIDNEYIGYNVSIEIKHSELYRKPPSFIVASLLEAIIEAQKIKSEYGYRFINLENEYQSDLFKIINNI